MPNEIQSEVKFCMSHVLNHLQTTVGLTSRYQLHRVLIWYQCIFWAMDNQKRTFYLLTILFIVKTLLYHTLSTASVKIFHDFFQWDKGTQQNGTMYWVFLSYSKCYCTTDRSSKQNDLVICKSIGFEELNDSRCIILYVLGSSLALIDTITSILHC